MGKSIKFQVLDSIGRLYEESKGCKLEDSFFIKNEAELSLLSDYFGTTKSQSLLIALVFALNYKGDTVDLSDLIDYFNCNPMKILQYHDDIDYLDSSAVFSKKKSRHKARVSGANDQFIINEKITEAILQNKPMPKIQNDKVADIFELLEKIYTLGEQRDDNEISSLKLLMQAGKLLSVNLHIPLVKKIDLLKLEYVDMFLYLYLIWSAISGKKTSYVVRSLKIIYDNETERIKQMQELISGASLLVKNNLVEIVGASFLDDTEIKLTDYSSKLLKEYDINIVGNREGKDNIISPSEIPFRELIFSKSEMKQVFLLKDLLKDSKFRDTQKRLTDINLPKGVTALLHGVPGTGKTEIVKQIAKETSRKLVRVEISQSKSMWFGESEKIIKRIFTDYKSFAQECERMPILLFNEADAIISKRRDVSNSNVAQTENVIQNIILEELEDFEGILIATTNLAKNLDSAFERRFLFKILFQKPDVLIRAKIWKLKLPFLSIENSKLLAEEFDFSGGQIDNIVRKNEIHQIIYGKESTLQNLLIFCSEETLVSNRAKIGFRNL